MLAGCGDREKRQDIGPKADAAVALVERLQKVKPLPKPLVLQPLADIDVTNAVKEGASCAFVPIGGGPAPILVAGLHVALLKAGNAAIVMAVDRGAASERPHYVGKTHTARIERLGGTGQARLTIEDADRREVYRAQGGFACSS